MLSSEADAVTDVELSSGCDAKDDVFAEEQPARQSAAIRETIVSLTFMVVSFRLLFVFSYLSYIDNIYNDSCNHKQRQNSYQYKAVCVVRAVFLCVYIASNGRIIFGSSIGLRLGCSCGGFRRYGGICRGGAFISAVGGGCVLLAEIFAGTEIITLFGKICAMVEGQGKR